jgi:hypothetical protein
MDKKSVKTGDAVVFVDPTGRSHNALVTQVWGPETYPDDNGVHPSVNLVWVETDPKYKDQYGQQIKHDTSVVHRVNQAAHGMFWWSIEDAARA